LRGYILNKLGLIQELKEKCHLTRDEASKVVEVFFGEMAKAFVKG
jgi:nucleoid DNA-binding protein